MLVAARQPTFVELYTPKIFTVLSERYRLDDFRADIVAGLTVAIVALPLSMAIAIASGVSPERGLYTSIVGGFLVSAFGGSRFQIGGPAGAFIVLVAATVNQHGFDGLVLATLMSGLIMLAVGLLRLGTFVKYIPYPVTVGFTAGIAVIIFSGELADLFGLTPHGKVPGPFVPKLMALFDAAPTVNGQAVAVAALSIGAILAVRRWRPQWPAYLAGVVIAGVAVWAFGLHVETIASRFGGIPNTLPLPHWPDLSPDKVVEMLPAALSFALLGSIESLLSAVVADSMTGRRHRSNAELVAQGIANIGSALFGGICVTGTIARTATNVRAGARGPLAGMMHALFLLLFVVIAAPLASYIPLAALAAVLCVVAWNMAERHQFATLLRSSRGDAVILLATFLLVVFRDLTEGIVVGFCLGTLLFLHRMAQAVEVRTGKPVASVDVPDDPRRYGAAALRRRHCDRSRCRRVPHFRSILFRRCCGRGRRARWHRRASARVRDRFFRRFGDRFDRGFDHRRLCAQSAAQRGAGLYLGRGNRNAPRVAHAWHPPTTRAFRGQARSRHGDGAR